MLSENEDDDTTDNQSDGPDDEEERQWEWRFGLVLEDAMGSKNEKKDTMTVYVADKDAEFLLKLNAEKYVFPSLLPLPSKPLSPSATPTNPPL